LGPAGIGRDEPIDFARDHRQSPPCIACTGGLDPGVYRQHRELLDRSKDVFGKTQNFGADLIGCLNLISQLLAQGHFSAGIDDQTLKVFDLALAVSHSPGTFADPDRMSVYMAQAV